MFDPRVLQNARVPFSWELVGKVTLCLGSQPADSVCRAGGEVDRWQSRWTTRLTTAMMWRRNMRQEIGKSDAAKRNAAAWQITDWVARKSYTLCAHFLFACIPSI